MIGKDKSIIRLSRDPEGFGETPDKLEAQDFRSEVPVQHTHSVFEDDEIGLYVGLWDTDTMVEAGGPYACDEFMWLIEGECQIRNNRTGTIETVKAGTPFVIPKVDAILTEVAEDAPFAITSGARPQHNVCYKDTTGRFFSGTWASEAFESGQRPFPYNEFAYVQDGSITLTDAGGAAQVFNAGDAFFIPERAECDATVVDSVRLYISVIKPG